MKSRRNKRMEKKKKKITALLEIAKLNDDDRALAKQNGKEEPNSKRVCIANDTKKTGVELKDKSYTCLKKELRERNNRTIKPKIWLRDIGLMARLAVDIDDRVPLFISDIQHLLLYAQIGQQSPYSPARWCQLDKFNKLESTCLLIVENMSMYDYVSNESLFTFLDSKFHIKLEVLNPEAYEGNIVQDLLMVPLTINQIRKFINQYGTLEAAANTGEVFNLLKKVFPIEKELPDDTTPSQRLPPTDKFPRTDLLLSGWQMVDENFPMPIAGLLNRKYQGYVMSKDEYKLVTAHSPMFGIDCEMCKTTSGDVELTRVSLVDEKHGIFYETLVKPYNPIVDYLTHFSGVTAQMMKDVTKRLRDVQDDLRRILPPDAILVGQSVGNDFHALKMFHPYVIDTSVIYNLSGQRLRKAKLQLLAKQFLNESIQEGCGGHCPTEDSMASIKLVQHKLTQSICYGDAVMNGFQNHMITYPDVGRSNYATSMFPQIARAGNTAAVYGTRATVDAYRASTAKEKDGAAATKGVSFEPVDENDDVARKMCDSLGRCSLNVGQFEWTRHEREEYARLDGVVRKVYEAAPDPSLLVVIFTGRGNSGCCFISVKK